MLWESKKIIQYFI